VRAPAPAFAGKRLFGSTRAAAAIFAAARGVEFPMGYYPILDRAPKGRDEGAAFQTWIRRHDEYA
jgi:predicted dithiol-disulfide oxidoreductase (DUF899 family)